MSLKRKYLGAAALMGLFAIAGAFVADPAAAQIGEHFPDGGLPQPADEQGKPCSNKINLQTNEVGCPSDEEIPELPELEEVLPPCKLGGDNNVFGSARNALYEQVEWRSVVRTAAARGARQYLIGPRYSRNDEALDNRAVAGGVPFWVRVRGDSVEGAGGCSWSVTKVVIQITPLPLWEGNPEDPLSPFKRLSEDFDTRWTLDWWESDAVPASYRLNWPNWHGDMSKFSRSVAFERDFDGPLHPVTTLLGVSIRDPKPCPAAGCAFGRAPDVPSFIFWPVHWTQHITVTANDGEEAELEPNDRIEVMYDWTRFVG